MPDPTRTLLHSFGSFIKPEFNGNEFQNEVRKRFESIKRKSRLCVSQQYVWWMNDTLNTCWKGKKAKGQVLISNIFLSFFDFKFNWNYENIKRVINLNLSRLKFQRKIPTMITATIKTTRIINKMAMIVMAIIARAMIRRIITNLHINCVLPTIVNRCLVWHRTWLREGWLRTSWNRKIVIDK